MQQAKWEKMGGEWVVRVSGVLLQAGSEIPVTSSKGTTRWVTLTKLLCEAPGSVWQWQLWRVASLERMNHPRPGTWVSQYVR